MDKTDDPVDISLVQQVKKDKKRLSPHVMFNKDPPKPQVSRKINMGNFGFKDLKPVEVGGGGTICSFSLIVYLAILIFLVRLFSSSSWRDSSHCLTCDFSSD